MTLPVVNFRDYRSRLLPCFNRNARLLKRGADFLFKGNRTRDKGASLLHGTVEGLDQIKFTDGAYPTLLVAKELYDGALNLSQSKNKLMDQPQKYRDLLAFYILTNTQEELEKTDCKLFLDQRDDYEEMLRMLLHDYARGAHYDEELRGELFSNIYQTLAFMRDTFGITLGHQRGAANPTTAPA